MGSFSPEISCPDLTTGYLVRNNQLVRPPFPYIHDVTDFDAGLPDIDITDLTETDLKRAKGVVISCSMFAAQSSKLRLCYIQQNQKNRAAAVSPFTKPLLKYFSESFNNCRKWMSQK